MAAPLLTKLHFGVVGLCCNDEVMLLSKVLRSEAGVEAVDVLLLANKAIVTTPLANAAAVDALAERLIARAASAALRMMRQGGGEGASLTLEVDAASAADAAALFDALKPHVAGVEVSRAPMRDSGSGRRPRRAVTLSYDSTAIGARELLGALPPRAHATVGSSAGAGNASERTHARRLAGAVALTVAAIVLDYAIPHGGAERYDEGFGRGAALSARILVLWALATAATVVYGLPLARNAASAFASSRTLTMDTLVTISSSVAYLYALCLLIASAAVGRNVSEEGMGEPPFETTAVLLGLVAVGREIEQGAKRRTQHAVKRLTQLAQVDAVIAVPAAVAAPGLLLGTGAALAPAVAAAAAPAAAAADPVGDVQPAEPTVVAVAPAAPAAAPAAPLGAPGSSLPPDLLHLNDIITVSPGQRFPADGTVVAGASTADESIVTGESAPVPKAAGNSVVGGTTNGEGVVMMRVTALPSTGTVSRIVSQIQVAQAARPRAQQVADSISAWFTPFVLAAGVVVFVAWVAACYSGAVTETQGLSPAAFAAQFALSLIVVSCPCAVGLAVPTVVMVATSVAARHGLLMKSGTALESAALLKHVIFDKTGTLTVGKPAVAMVRTAHSAQGGGGIGCSLAARPRRLAVPRAPHTPADCPRGRPWQADGHHELPRHSVHSLRVQQQGPRRRTDGAEPGAGDRGVRRGRQHAPAVGRDHSARQGAGHSRRQPRDAAVGRERCVATADWGAGRRLPRGWCMTSLRLLVSSPAPPSRLQAKASRAGLPTRTMLPFSSAPPRLWSTRPA